MSDDCSELREKLNQYITKKETSTLEDDLSPQNILSLFSNKAKCLSNDKISDQYVGWQSNSGWIGLSIKIKRQPYNYVSFSLRTTESDTMEITSRNEFSGFTCKEHHKFSEFDDDLVTQIFRKAMDDLT